LPNIATLIATSTAHRHDAGGGFFGPGDADRFAFNFDYSRRS
jgi:hypothetical protein